MQLQDIALDRLNESTWNPRHHYDDGKLRELADSITAKGILEPILARPKANGRADALEIVAGSRRYRAAKMAGLSSVPVIVRDLDDVAALEVAVIENGQREDIHPLDEALGYQALMAADKRYTPDVVAAKVGKGVSTIKKRLKLLNLSKDVQGAFLADAITSAHAERLARLPEKLQREGLRECFHNLYAAEGDFKAKNWAVLREHGSHHCNLDRWIERTVVADPTDAEMQEALPELGPLVATAKAAGKSVVIVSDSWYLSPAQLKAMPGIIAHQDFLEIGVNGHGADRKRCDNVEQVFVAHGGPKRIIEICRAKPCPVHRPAPTTTSSSSSPSRSTRSANSAADARWRKEDAKRKAAAAIWDKLHEAAVTAIVPILKTAKANAAVVINRLGPVTVKTIEKRTGLKLTDATAVGVLLADDLIDHVWNRESLVKFTKAIGFDFPAFEREFKKTLPKPAAKKTTKKAAPATKKAAKKAKR